jgi:hypothetical protein
MEMARAARPRPPPMYRLRRTMRLSFVAQINKRSGKNPDANSALGYDAVYDHDGLRPRPDQAGGDDQNRRRGDAFRGLDPAVKMVHAADAPARCYALGSGSGRAASSIAASSVSIVNESKSSWRSFE